MTKKQYVVANWKMYKTAHEATDYIEKLLPQVENSSVRIYLAVPFTSIAPAAHFAKGTHVVIGAQNMNDAREGAFTGEIAALMLKEAGASFVLIGHSERRHIFKEDAALIHRKVIRALQDDIQPILCVGETLQEFEQDQTQQVLTQQLGSALDKIPPEEASRIILAYEPVWAIGTGKTAQPNHIQEAHQICRSILAELFGKKIAATIPILYGGSVKLENVSKITETDNVDGILVGGASLNPQTLAMMVEAIEKKPSRKPKK